VLLAATHGDGCVTLRARQSRVRAIGPYYVASAREHERFGDGRRYLLWKEYYLSEPRSEEPYPPGDGRLAGAEVSVKF